MRHLKTGENFVIKKIKIVKLEYQLKEIQMHQELIHPNIIRLIDYSICREFIYMLIEFAKFGNLNQNKNMLSKFTKEQILEFFYKIVKSINYCHKK